MTIRKPFLARVFVLSMTVFACFFSANAQDFIPPAQGEKETYERLGLSLTEWNLIKESNMPMAKVHRLLEAGISISEYFKKPWVELGVTEGTWIEKREAGLTNEDIKAGRTKPSKGGEWSVAKAFILPGYLQLKRKQNLKGGTMASVALLSVLFGAGTLYQNLTTPGSADYWPVFFLISLPASMLWSGIDMHKQIQLELNPAAQRFSINECRIHLSIMAGL